MATDVKRQHNLRSYYFLPMRTSLKRTRCYLADDVDALVADLREQLNGLYKMNTEEFASHHKQVAELRDCIKGADNAGLKALEERNIAEKNARDLQRQLDECQALIKTMEKAHAAEVAELRDKLRASEKQNEDIINSASQIMILQDKALENKEGQG